MKFGERHRVPVPQNEASSANSPNGSGGPRSEFRDGASFFAGMSCMEANKFNDLFGKERSDEKKN